MNTDFPNSMKKEISVHRGSSKENSCREEKLYKVPGFPSHADNGQALCSEQCSFDLGISKLKEFKHRLRFIKIINMNIYTNALILIERELSIFFFDAETNFWNNWSFK